MPQSAIKVPQGESGVKVIKEPVRIYCRTAGDDVEGDGSITNPFFSIHRAFRYLENFIFTEAGCATIDVGPGTFNFSTTCQVNDRSGKISIAGVCPSFFNLRQVTEYNYSDGHDGNTAAHIDNFMTMELVKPGEPTVLSTEGINKGDWLLIENRSLQAEKDYDTAGYDSYGLTGGDPDKSIAAVGCYEVHSVSASTVTVKHRAKNHRVMCHPSDVGAERADSSLDIGIGDPIFIGGASGGTPTMSAAFDDYNPEGYYGSDAISGTGANSVLIGDEFRVKVIKSVLKWKDKKPAISGMVLSPGAAIDGMENLIFAGGNCTKYYHEYNPVHAAPAITLRSNNSIVTYNVEFNNIGIAGWGYGIIAMDSTVRGKSIVCTDSGYGIIATQNSSVEFFHGTMTQNDIASIYATKNSSVNFYSLMSGLNGFVDVAANVVASINLPAVASGWTTIDVDGTRLPFRITSNPSYRNLPEFFSDLQTDLGDPGLGRTVYGQFQMTNGGDGRCLYPVDGAVVGEDGITYAVGEYIYCPQDRV